MRALGEGMDKIEYHRFHQDRKDIVASLRAYFIPKMNHGYVNKLKEIIEHFCLTED